jgi:prepilin-type N-terminal cleavage/methylation domain-containing protein
VTLKVLKRSNGFSLIEVIIALFILAIALLALAGLMISTTKNNSFGGHMTEAVIFAQDKLEQLRAAPWTSIIAGWDTVTTATPGAPGTGILYTRTWALAPNPGGTQIWITVTINWTDPTAKTTHTINFRSPVSQ